MSEWWVERAWNESAGMRYARDGIRGQYSMWFEMTDRFQYVWKPRNMCDDWKVDGGVGTKDGYAAVAFTAAGEWYIFVDMPDRNLAPRPGEVEMLTEGDIFDYGKALWELSR